MRWRIHGVDSHHTASIRLSRCRFASHGVDSHVTVLVRISRCRFASHGVDSHPRRGGRSQAAAPLLLKRPMMSLCMPAGEAGLARVAPSTVPPIARPVSAHQTKLDHIWSQGATRTPPAGACWLAPGLRREEGAVGGRGRLVKAAAGLQQVAPPPRGSGGGGESQPSCRAVHAHAAITTNILRKRAIRCARATTTATTTAPAPTPAPPPLSRQAQRRAQERRASTPIRRRASRQEGMRMRAARSAQQGSGPVIARRR